MPNAKECRPLVYFPRPIKKAPPEMKLPDGASFAESAPASLKYLSAGENGITDAKQIGRYLQIRFSESQGESIRGGTRDRRRLGYLDENS